MTQRLYYDDPYCRAFDAVIAAVHDSGGRTLLELDRTAFYPTSGGQPFDTGLLGSARVVDVVDDEDGKIQHVIERGAGAPAPLHVGEAVHGEIDWPRRFDHMQQHTGQHVLSAALERLSGAKTMSFHLGAQQSTIDLARELSAEQLLAGEAEANRIVWENRAVAIRYADADQAAAMPLRKESKREGVLRLIDVEGHDLSACGGTHVAQTGAIGMIALGSWERFKGGQRVEFWCGGRALARFGAMRDTVASAVRLLSVLPQEIPGAVERLKADHRDAQRAVAALQSELSRYRATDLIANARTVPAGKLVEGVVDGDASVLRSLAYAVLATPGVVVAFASSQKPVAVVVARAADVTGIDANRVVGTLTSKFGGRGGGRSELAQAGGLDADPHIVLALAREALSAGL